MGEHESAVVDDNVTVEMGNHDSEQMDDLKSAVLRRCFTPRTKQQRAALRRRQAEERQRQRVIRGLVCEARQRVHELMDLIVARNSLSRFEPWPDLSQI